MMCVQEKTSLLDEFSGQVQRHFPASVWRSLFLDRTGTAQFGTSVRTILCIECPVFGPITRDGVMAAVTSGWRACTAAAWIPARTNSFWSASPAPKRQCAWRSPFNGPPPGLVCA